MKSLILGILGVMFGVAATAAGVQVKEVAVGVVHEPVFRMVVERINKPSIEGIDVKKNARVRGISLCELVEVKKGQKNEIACEGKVNLYLIESNEEDFAKALCTTIMADEFSGEHALLITAEADIKNLIMQGTGLSYLEGQMTFSRLNMKSPGLQVLGVDCSTK